NPRDMLVGISHTRSALILAYTIVAFFASFSVLLEHVRTNLRLSVAFWTATAGLIFMLLLLQHRIRHTGWVLTYKFAPKKVHYVQLTMHSCIYAYWGWYWHEVYRYAPLILSQIIFAYSLDMLLSWWRRKQWVVGFGPFPIVLSTNLF